MKTFEKNMIDVYGDRGVNWLADLPYIIVNLAKKYGLTDLRPVSNMSFNYVASGYQNNQPIILKASLDCEALAKEAHCLNSFASRGGAKILASEKGILIIERAVPGTTLKGYFPNKEDEAIRILSLMIKNLHAAEIPKDHSFDTINDLLKTLDDDFDIPIEILVKARSLRDALLSSVDKTVLLHGDLHHENILQNSNHWIAIDPKGFIGDPIYDVCAFISNPIPDLLASSNPREIINHRVRLCAKSLEFSEQRIYEWHYVHTVLCWAWQLEDNLDPQYFIKLSKIIN